MSSEICFDIAAKQRGELVTELRPGRGAHGPAARVIERVRRRLGVEDIRHEALM
jgi:hypothetical protein